MATKHTTDAVDLDLVAIGILREGNQLVMVRSPSEGGHPRWLLPGGLIEGGELVEEGLKREVREETGVEVITAGPLAFLSHIDRPDQNAQTIVFAFAIEKWRGDLSIDDPDGEIEDVALVPLGEACRRLRDNGSWRGVQEPLLACLEGRATPGSAWFYREGPNGQQLVVQPLCYRGTTCTMPSHTSGETNTATPISTATRGYSRRGCHTTGADPRHGLR